MLTYTITSGLFYPQELVNGDDFAEFGVEVTDNNIDTSSINSMVADIKSIMLEWGIDSCGSSDAIITDYQTNAHEIYQLTFNGDPGLVSKAEKFVSTGRCEDVKPRLTLVKSSKAEKFVSTGRCEDVKPRLYLVKS